MPRRMRVSGSGTMLVLVDRVACSHSPEAASHTVNVVDPCKGKRVTERLESKVFDCPSFKRTDVMLTRPRRLAESIWFELEISMRGLPKPFERDLGPRAEKL